MVYILQSYLIKVLKVQEDELQKATIALSDRISSCISNTGRKLSM